MTEEDFIKLDKIWLQFMQWKNNHGGLLSQKTRYNINSEEEEEEFDDNYVNVDMLKSLNRTIDYINYENNLKNYSHYKIL